MPYTPPNPAQTHDATADFAAAMSDPTRWVIKRGVPIFKPHQRTDPATGNLISVDVPKLYRIAANMQRLERAGGVPIRLTLGHTEPGKPETEQPPVGGYYRNARVQPFGPSGEPAVVVDEWLDPQYLRERKNFPYRSAEYYDDAEQITGVALLTRDPYLDLGVVAYSRTKNGAVHYARTASGASPVMYEFLTTGDVDMYPPAAPAPVVPPNPTPYGSWAGAGGNYNPQQTIPHPHTNTGAIYGQPQMPMPPMAGMPPQMNGNTPPAPDARTPGFPPTLNAGMPPGMNPPGDDDEQAGLYALHHHLGQAVEHLSRYLGGKRSAQYGQPGAAPQTPFPPNGQPSGPTPNSRYGKSDPEPGAVASATEEERRRNEGRDADHPIRNSAYGYNQPPRQYSATGGAPAVTQWNGQTTISGLPTQYQLVVDRMEFELNETKRAMQVLLYERDSADTEACIAEIRRLASIGFPVGDVELTELKAKPRDQRPGYIQHITTKYARVPAGGMPPPIMGDPTPGPMELNNRPATQAEMEAALKLASQTNDPNGYQNALMYIRTGGTAPGGVNRLVAYPPQHGGHPAAPGPMPGEWGAGEPMPQMPHTFTDPYGEPSRNGY